MTHAYLPAEWHPQQAVMLTWPHADSDWKNSLADVENVFVKLAREIARCEAVIIVYFDEAHRLHIQSLLSPSILEKVSFYQAVSDDTWARDHGPLTLLEGKQHILLDFVFNGWGNKFSASRDNQITSILHRQGVFRDAKIRPVDFVLEGGSIEVDGQGTLLTTKQCLLAKNRNPHLTQAEIEKQLMALLGVQRFLWLDHGFLAGDDTDSHVDTLARFTDPHTICYMGCPDKEDEHYTALRLMEQELENFRTAKGEPYRLFTLPWPSPKYNAEGQRLPATYANFLVLNGAVLMPTYRDPMDAVALKQLQICFPDREIVGIDCTALIHQGGSLHCVTMQLPSTVLT